MVELNSLDRRHLEIAENSGNPLRMKKKKKRT
jgi:hypothetical protein